MSGAISLAVTAVLLFGADLPKPLARA
ncbi:MAG: hypothetical protein QG656_766, partial [Candidatus Hydrogenedentes bacterium]|nr:hypothetical protein [Candidatus Hydrogenedentota bacterium]